MIGQTNKRGYGGSRDRGIPLAPFPMSNLVKSQGAFRGNPPVSLVRPCIPASWLPRPDSGGWRNIVRHAPTLHRNTDQAAPMVPQHPKWRPWLSAFQNQKEAPAPPRKNNNRENKKNTSLRATPTLHTHELTTVKLHLSAN